MRSKTAFWAAPLALLVAAAWSGDCFSQAHSGQEPSDKRAPAAATNASERIVAAASLNPLEHLNIQADPAGENTAGAAKLGESVPPEKRPGQTSSSKVGIGVKVSTLGVGIESAVPVTSKLNLRGGFNFLRYNRGITNDGIQYNAHLHFQSGEAHIDLFPFSGFHVSPGLLFYNGNALVATAAVPGGQNFTVGGTTYQSDPSTPVNGTGTLDFVKVSPSIMVGIGNLIPRNGRHYSFLFEIGGAYQGSARVALNLSGNVCDTSGLVCRSVASDPTVQANIQAQEQKIKKDINPYRFFPVVSIGIGFNF